MDSDRPSRAKYSIRSSNNESIEPDKISLIVFPKPLAHVELSPITDKTSFTGNEKAVLRNAFLVIKRHFRTHAFEIFLNFFTDNYTMLDRFCGRNGKFNLDNLNQHALSVLSIYGRLINEGFDMPTLIHIILIEVVLRHEMAGVKPTEINLYTNAFAKYCLNVMHNIRSPTLNIALDKLTDTITSYHEGIHLLESDSKWKMREGKSGKSIVKGE